MTLRPKFVCVPLFLAALAIVGSSLPAYAQTAVRSQPLDPKSPPYAKNALFVEDSCGPVPFYLASNLRTIDILGKPAIGGNFYMLEGDTSGSVVIIPSETKHEFWFVSTSGPWGLITVRPGGKIDWVDGNGNSGFIIRF
jgi:hypothetical protein